MLNRKDFLKNTAISIPFISLFSFTEKAEKNTTDFAKIIKAKKLNKGDTIGLVSPASNTMNASEIDIVVETYEALGLKVKKGKHLLDRWGYLAGTDIDRAQDINDMFADDAVHAVMPITGGWGCARILPYINYELIAKHPKPFMGFSDITALLIAFYAKCGLITFHGPNAARSNYNAFTLQYVQGLLFNNEALIFKNVPFAQDEIALNRERILTITPGKATGRLVGGNLTVLCHIIGSAYLPNWDNVILFIEDTGEKIYRIDRMLTQLKLAGILDNVKGIVFGKCSNCDHDGGISGFTLEEVLTINLGNLNKPVFSGGMFGHVRDKFTLPHGALVEIDASAGTITMLEKALVG